MNPDYYEALYERIESHGKFGKGIYTDTLWAKVPMARELAISAGQLGTVARRTFLAELEYQTLRYVVISEHTPLLWMGAFGWLLVSRRHFSGVSNEDYLILLEIAYDLGQGEKDD